MIQEAFESTYHVLGRDFPNAGRVSTSIKDTLKRMGIHPLVVRRIAIVSYEAEMNLVIHTDEGGEILVEVRPDRVSITATDAGPGIADISLAMQEGWSTAPDEVRNLGFGAGMGLPNMKKNADDFDIRSAPGQGTTVRMTVYINTEGR